MNKINNKIKINLKKCMIVAIVLVLNILGFANSLYAVSTLENKSANVYMVEDCESLLKYKGMVVRVRYVEYENEGVKYPAYCMDKHKEGVGSDGINSDIVTVQKNLQDVGLWRVVINGYPYKTIEELGVANKQEAFTATKQAIYCYLHENTPEDYEAIGEAGQRTLNALKNIVNNANKSTETKISSTIKIEKTTDKWEQDKMEKSYVSKTYKVNAGAVIEKYHVKITKESGEKYEGIKITDENNNERNEFLPNEKFKALIPIKDMKENGEIKLEVEAKVKTKPVLYGMTSNPGYQDYALTTGSFEDGKGEISDKYGKNETKIIVIKKDQNTGEQLQGTEFELLDKDLETIYTDLKTDEEGRIVIENLVPGLYYLNETKAKDGYEAYSELIKVEVALNEEVTVTVNNKKEEKPDIELKMKTSKEAKKLPITGM